ncbi:hypothetical protein UFOVP1382_153 [uncultured Caudovirales phage]|uniref:Type II toxin-antitoxin system HicA family toxin n=1 Tax=uncultured Caudovirales phage TaxID=2100421 RepID=A0A6J5S3X9_9CAUD|nr:hypothetical protein UFOVP1382_153 [uncultured Caudovirales phage]
MSSKQREVDALVKQIRRLGFTVDKTGAGHWRVASPSGPIFMPSTPSDWRAVKNMRAALRRAGIAIE